MVSLRCSLLRKQALGAAAMIAATAIAPAANAAVTYMFTGIAGSVVQTMVYSTDRYVPRGTYVAAADLDACAQIHSSEPCHSIEFANSYHDRSGYDVLSFSTSDGNSFGSAYYAFARGAFSANGMYRTIDGLNSGYLSVSGFSEGVPEPSAWAMLISGFGLIGASLRRTRRLPRPARLATF